jgi:hypothetical protein
MGTFDSSACVTIRSLVMPSGENATVLPTFDKRVDVVVLRNQSRFMINTMLRKQVGIDSSDDSPQILGQDQIVLPGLNHF